ncbi:MAG: TonB family protein [Acidobacteriia bacterium]|nr:TonB family protein [Terriglobia bacterium]
MFDQLVVSSVNPNKTNKSWTVLISTLVQFLLVGIMILIPLIYTEALPKGMLSTFIVAPAPPPPPPPPAAPVKIVKPVRIIQPQRMVAPTVIPKRIEIVKEEAPDVGMASSVGVVGGTGALGGSLGGIIGAPPPPKPVVTAPVRIGGNVMEAKALERAQPMYPAIAKAAHVQGTVVLHAIISKEGVVEQLQLISGPPLLVSSAMDAVRQWRYRPTLLNGEAVEVDTTIQVVFTLGG